MKSKFRVSHGKRPQLRGSRAVLGAGVSAAAMAGASGVEAAIIYNDIDDLSFSVNRSQLSNNFSLNLSALLNGSVNNGSLNDATGVVGSPDFALNLNAENDDANNSINNVNLSFRSLNNAAEAIFNPLNNGDPINNENFGDNLSGMNFNLSPINNNNNANRNADWAGMSNVFLGVRIDVPNASDHFGWVQVSVDSAANGLSFTVHDLALESVANRGIIAGQTVPEPGTLALFALGAAGLGAWRARKSACA